MNPSDSRRVPANSATRAILVFVFGLGFFEGFIYNFLPITFPIFAHQFGASLEQLGRVLLLFFLSTLVFSIAGGWLIDRFGLRKAAVGILGALILALLITGFSAHLAALFTGASLLGLAVIGMEVLGAAIITELTGGNRQSNFFIWSVANAVGAAIGPAVLGAFVRGSAATPWMWRAGYLGSAAIAALFLTGPLIPGSDWGQHSASAETRLSAFDALSSVLKRPAIYAVGVVIFLHGVAQIGMVSWIGQVYLKRFPIDSGQAALFISFNSVGFFIGRSLMSVLTRRWKIPELTLLTCCAGLGSIAYMATIAAPGYRSGLLFFTLAGALIAGNGPSINSCTGERFPIATATAFAVMNGFGNIGAAAGPYLVGVIGNNLGLERGIRLLPGFGFALAAFAAAWQIYEVRQRRAQPLTSVPGRPASNSG